MQMYLVSVCVLALVACTKGFSDAEKAKMTEMLIAAAEDCAKKIQLTESDMNIYKTEHRIADTETGACFAKCMLESFGIIKDGKYVREGLMASAQPFIADNKDNLQVITAVSDKCEKEVGEDADACQLSKKIMECTHKYKDELGFDIFVQE